VTEYKKAYNAVPDGLAAMGYDAAMVLADAMNRAPDLNSASVRTAIAQTVNFPGVTGTITINSERNAVKPAVVLVVENGQYKYRTTITP
jgi:branched-chain amino acid transport system substrate-binding protein